MWLGPAGVSGLLRMMPGVTIGTVDRELHVTGVAGSWLERTGLTPEQVVGRSFAELGAPTTPEIVDAIAAAFEGTSSRIGLRNCAAAIAGGAPEQIEITVAPGEPDAGEPRVVWLVRDVTGEHELGTALSTAEQRLAMMGDDVRGHGLFTLDLDGVLTGWGPAVQRLFGFAPEEIVGRHLSRLFPPEAVRRGAVHGLLQGARAAGEARIETDLVGHGGAIRCEVSVRVLRDRRAEPVGLAASVRDLSAHDRTAATIAMRERMYRAAFDDAPSGMALVERDAAGRFEILEANTALASLVGLPVSALVGGGATLRAMVDDPDSAELFDLAPQDPGVRYEVALVRADGSRRRVVLGLSPLSAAGGEDGVHRFVAQFHDVTARREAEQATAEALARERRMSAEFRELQRQRSDFLATVSHELRTPLSSVLGFVELLCDGDLGPLAGPQERALDAIARNSRRLRDLVEDLLVMSSIERTPRRRAPACTAVADVLTSAIARVRPEALARGMGLSAAAAPGLTVDLDAVSLARVLAALLTNAVKFGAPGGRVTVDAAAADGQVVIAVVDDGVGIDPQDLPRVFDPFFRGAASERLSTSGTGLGLTFVRRTVELHGGEVEVTSEPGRFTRFEVRLAAVAVAVPVGGAA